MWALGTGVPAVLTFLSDGWGARSLVPIMATVLPLLCIVALAGPRPMAAGRVAAGAATALLLPSVVLLPIGVFYALVAVAMGAGQITVAALAIFVAQVLYLRHIRRAKLFVAPLGFGALAAIIGFVLPFAAFGTAWATERAVREYADAKGNEKWEQARGRIFSAAACALRARDTAGTFPDSLPQSCRPSPDDSAGTGWVVTYAPDSGRRNFVVRGEGPAHGQVGIDEIEIDSLGLLMRDRRRDLKDGESEISVDGGVYALRRLAKCLKTDARPGATAAEVVGVAPKAPPPMGECVGVNWQYNRLQAEPDGRVRSARGHLYGVRWTDAAARQFEIELRPLEYGRTAIRSFLLDAQDSLHSTAQDRAATRADVTWPW